ncbi:hypothetical protein DYY66_1352 [Candidatus Nitrosotalea sp. FS]|uniref:hypothetical protein n=1 Tax=Candidatus Nitrosotalea sp. FS TaxID=2341021 RepID=UPI0014080905|nr:hypothetical protein [Candidatus Nitrosotalea sp. FS]NHH97083.1 hypothetical protein [Candidatus Nitrosotalea sp. FS]
MKKSILSIAMGGGFAAVAIFLLVIFLPIIPISEKYSISVDPIIVKDEMGTETHVAIRNTGTDALTHVVVYYGGSAKSDIIPTLNPGEKISLSPPEGSELNEVRITTDQGINITKEYRTPASASFVGNSGYGG